MVRTMDVTKLQKMNVLASTLKEHGLAASREEAADLAGDMVGTKNEDECGKVFAEPEPVQTKAPKEEENQMNEQQIKKILQNFTDQFCSEINKINERLASYEETITRVQASECKPQSVEPKVEQVKLEPEKPQQESSGFSSDDVAIDKIFYFGQK